MKNEPEERADKYVAFVELDEVAVGMAVVEEIALEQDLDEAVGGREAFGVLEKDGKAVDRGVDEFVGEVGVGRV